MLAPERRQFILKELESHRTVQVADLSRAMDVTEMTVRRDLSALEQEGKLERFHGGASLMDQNALTAKNEKIPEKEKIADRAVQLIRPSDTCVYLDAGSTTIQIAKRILERKNLTVITNDLHIGSVLCSSSCEKIIMIGGTLEKRTMSCLGFYALDVLHNLRIDVAFIGTDHITPDFKATTTSVEKAYLKKTIREQSERSYLAADHSKFNKTALYHVDLLKDYTGVITDRRFNDAERALIKEKKITIIPA